MAYTGPDLCLTDYGMVEVTSEDRRKAWALGLPLWEVCSLRAWEAQENAKPSRTENAESCADLRERIGAIIRPYLDGPACSEHDLGMEDLARAIESALAQADAA